MKAFSHRLRRATIAAGACTAALLLLEFTPAEGADGIQAPASTPASIAAGKDVFFEYCSGCHGRRADGRGPQSLNLNPRPQNLRNTQFVTYLSDERMYGSVSGGVRGTAMPAFELVISTEKRWQVIHYLRSLTADDPIRLPNALASQTVPADAKNPLSESKETVDLGRKNWLSYCASCHGQQADGNGLLSENLVPRPRNLVAVTSWGEKPFIDYMPDSRLYESITNGVPGTSMSPWIKVLTDTDRWSIVSFLRERGSAERAKAEQMSQ